MLSQGRQCHNRTEFSDTLLVSDNCVLCLGSPLYDAGIGSGNPKREVQRAENQFENTPLQM